MPDTLRITNMKAATIVILAISGFAIAATHQAPGAREAPAPVKDNRNLKYVHNVPMAKTLEQVEAENESS